ncbi:tRNA (adenosine(37)-N6)-threonylcarbamoyltransferase complex dimerization subunit type 1 TsaB [Paenibacillus nasutitermitis]|uniref:tRNA threonylcarbamoyladenosine biosynthesis protein TsaB n=1 Tax=Paenibacillus nasutitermitis TaxID=1652958 RepID=A0A916ZG71_9BACL|nr:tRNA (adenosine(37)-N6)-threonylcarbamoyltransferase complex dimerization subunit type 1 TsaB [Paenibacillus nasutitermitis]GGD94639.1 tRNA threonylcarbamoyladenosine biosynthesis protein TsaB [Paenibacillus nasutitermitis]
MKMQMTEGGAEGKLVVLALDTSTASLAAALIRGGQTLASVQSLAERNHSLATVSKLKSLLEETGIKPDELDGIAIGRGPGSYTGMRIAVSVGKTLAWVWDKPLVGVSSLEALAYGAWKSVGSVADAQLGIRHKDDERHAAVINRPRWLVPIMDARRGQVYTSAFEVASDGSWNRSAADGVRLMRDWVAGLEEKLRVLPQAAVPAELWVIGDLSMHEAECQRLQELCSRNGTGCQVRRVPFTMEGTAVAVLGAVRLAAGERDEVHAFVPNYTQLTEAEVKLNKSREEGAGAS